MAGTNNILKFCDTDIGTNLESQAAYAADANRPIGNQPGVASSKFDNKAMRQALYMANQLAQFLVDRTGSSILDTDGAIAADAVKALLNTALKTAPTMTVLTAGSGVYTPPANVLWLRVRLVGGGGCASGPAGVLGTAATDTTFGTALLVGHKANGRANGAASLGGALGVAIPGSPGAFAQVANGGGAGGGTPFASGGQGGTNAVFATQPVANSGAGGGGAAATGAGAVDGAGGGSGGYVDAILTTVLASYNYVVGTGQPTAFTTTAFATGGADGQIIIEEHYN